MASRRPGGRSSGNRRRSGGRAARALTERFLPGFEEIENTARRGSHANEAMQAVQRELERKREIALKLDLIREVNSKLRPLERDRASGTFLSRRRFNKFRSLSSEFNLLKARLLCLGMTQAELNSVLKSRASNALRFNSWVETEIKKKSKGIPTEKIAEIKREIFQWSFVDSNSKEDVNFHFLIELERLKFK